MDFQSLNRRELQSLCKLNKIPANMTNVAMANALKSLETVEGIEEIMNPSRSEAGSSIESPEKMEVTSPRVPRTSCRTSTRQNLKKPETESQPATASRTSARGVRRQLGGDVNEYMKTPSVTSTRKKAPTTCSLQNGLSQLNECEESVKKQTTVQRVYSTRRSVRMSEKKCAETGLMQRERTQPVKIDSFLEEMSVTSENVGSDICSMETSNESNENTKDIVGEESDDACVSKAKVEEICNEFEKLDVVVVDESDQKLDLEENIEIIGKHSVEINESDQKVDLEICNEFEKHNVEIIEKHENVNLEGEHKFVMNEMVNSEDKSSQVDEQKPVSEVISYPCEDSDEESEEKLIVIDEQIDLTESPNVSGNIQIVYVATDNLKPDLEEISNPSEDWDLIDDLNEALNVSVKEQKVDSDVVVVDESDQKVDLEDLCNVEIKKHENVNLEDEHKFVMNEIDSSEQKPGSEVISYPCEESEEKLMVKDEQNDPNESLNVSENIYFAPEEEKSGQIDNLIPYLEDVSNPSEDGDSIDEKIDLSEAMKQHLEDISNRSEDIDSIDEKIDLNESLNVSVKEQKVDSGANTRNPNDTSFLKLEDINNEMTNNGSTNIEDLIQSNTENPSEVSELDKPDEMTAVGIEDNTSTCTVDAYFVNPNEQEADMEFKPTDEKEQKSLTAIDVMPTKYEELDLNSEQVNQETQFSVNTNDVIDHAIHLEPMNHESRNDIKDKDENIDEKGKVLSDTISIRQLKKQLKALSINTNKVAEERPALQAVCDNQVANGEEN